MNSQNNREPYLAALGFLIPTILSLVISWISSEKEVTPVTYWLVMIFVVLVTVGALVEWARKSTDQNLPTPPGPTPPRQEPTPLRTTRAILAGAISGLVVSLLFFLVIGPGSHATTAAPHASPTVTVTPGSTPPTSTPTPTVPSTTSSGQLMTVRATPGDGGTQFGDEVTVTVTVGRPPPAGDTYWLIVQFRGGPNVVYKAAGKVPAALGTSDYSFSIASSAVGSTRKIYVLQADSQAGAVLAQNYAHQEPSWDGNRTSLPSGVIAVSNSVPVTKQVG
ncbi:MAG: hypothetical protein ACRDOD_07615 [Streptosporangiaceae bacterium]